MQRYERFKSIIIALVSDCCNILLIIIAENKTKGSDDEVGSHS